MPKKNAINRIIIFFAVFILCLSAVPAWASIFQGLAERLDLFRDRNWVYNNVGEPDSVSWNTTFKAELEMYRISGSSYFDWYFVSYGLDGKINILGQIYKKGYMSGYEVCEELESRGGFPAGTTGLGKIFRIQHTRTGKSIRVAVQDNKKLGQTVVYMLTQDAWDRVN